MFGIRDSSPIREQETKKPRSMAGLSGIILCRCALLIITTRKIDMIGLIYGESATQSSRINEDFFSVKDLGGMNNCCFLESFEPLTDAGPPVAARTLR